MHDGPSTVGSSAPVQEVPFPRARLSVGSDVCVWNSFLDSWTGGFRVAEVVPGGYRLRRMSDGHVFADVFATAQVIRERRQVQLPGYGADHIDRRRHLDDEEPPSAAGTPRLCQ